MLMQLSMWACFYGVCTLLAQPPHPVQTQLDARVRTTDQVERSCGLLASVALQVAISSDAWFCMSAQMLKRRTACATPILLVARARA